MVTENQRVIETQFRLFEEDHTKVVGDSGQQNGLIHLAYKMGRIPKPTLQAFMEFAINSAQAVLKQDYEYKKGIRR